MIRRDPTRIEPKFDDINDYEVMRKEQDQRKVAAQKATADSPSDEVVGLGAKTKTQIINERIGYSPKPVAQPSRLPIH